MKIKTDRAWELETKKNNDCLEIIEHHEGGDEYNKSYIFIPIEAVDRLVFELLKFKRYQK